MAQFGAARLPNMPVLTIDVLSCYQSQTKALYSSMFDVQWSGEHLPDDPMRRPDVFSEIELAAKCGRFDVHPASCAQGGCSAGAGVAAAWQRMRQSLFTGAGLGYYHKYGGSVNKKHGSSNKQYVLYSERRVSFFPID